MLMHNCSPFTCGNERKLLFISYWQPVIKHNAKPLFCFWSLFLAQTTSENCDQTCVQQMWICWPETESYTPGFWLQMISSRKKTSVYINSLQTVLLAYFPCSWFTLRWWDLSYSRQSEWISYLCDVFLYFRLKQKIWTFQFR